MSYIFSRALVEAYWEANCSESEPSVPSSLNPIPQAYCSPGRMTAYSRLSRFGMTYAPLTDDHGTALLTWYLEAFLARTSAFPESEKDWKRREADCGQKWRESFAKFDRDSSSWKIPQTLPGWDLTVSSETWPKWGTTRNGVCWERTPGPRLKSRSASILKKGWVCIGITYASRESSLLMTCLDCGGCCMSSLAEGFGKSDPADASPM